MSATHREAERDLLFFKSPHEQREGAGASPSGENSTEQQAGGAQGINPFKQMYSE
ncbi:MAG: hypothetical protein AAFY10_11920 [Pseudomonadota bacterium]